MGDFASGIPAPAPSQQFSMHLGLQRPELGLSAHQEPAKAGCVPWGRVALLGLSHSVHIPPPCLCFFWSLTMGFQTCGVRLAIFYVDHHETIPIPVWDPDRDQDRGSSRDIP